MLVGLCGAGGSGKDTVADFMVKNYDFVKIAFADPFKRFCQEVFDFSDEQLWGPSSARNKPDARYPRGTITMQQRQPLEEPDLPPLVCPQYLTPRFALQQIGSEWGRTCYPNVWADYAIRIARKLLESTYEEVGVKGYHSLYYSAQGGLWQGVNTRQVVGVVIADVRFKNEIDAIHAAGGKVVKIVRKGHGGLAGEAGQHGSETEMQGIPDEVFDHHLLNHATDLALLEAAVGGLVGVLQR